MTTRSDLLAYLADAIDAVAVSHPTRVAVDGPDAAGKTMLADELAAVLTARGRSVIRASVDGFHRPRAQRYRRGPDSPAGYYEDSFDLGAIRENLLRPLGPGGDLAYRVALFNYRTDQSVRPSRLTAPADAVLLFDGVFLQRPELRGEWDYTVFVDCAFDEIVRRALRRDLELFRDVAEIERRYRGRYLPAQQVYFAAASPRSNADVVVANDDPDSPRWCARQRGDARPG
ncbi:MAG: hypothetical protein U0R50_01050 [Gaiellales bacterium]